MGRADDDDHEMSPQAADAVMGQLLWGMFGLDEDERPLCDEARIEHAVELFSRQRSTTSIKGDEMSWGLWCLKREGLRARVEAAVRTAGVPAWLLAEAESWSDDELRAWLAKHEARELEKNFAQAAEQSRIRHEAQRARLARGARVVLVVGSVDRRDAISNWWRRSTARRPGATSRCSTFAARSSSPRCRRDFASRWRASSSQRRRASMTWLHRRMSRAYCGSLVAFRTTAFAVTFRLGAIRTRSSE